MREIKFRAWDKEKKKMLFNREILKNDLLYDTSGRNLLFELMQFTGLKDKNGKEIYEGDILKAVLMRQFGKNDVWYEKIVKCQISEEHYGFGFEYKTISEKKIKRPTRFDFDLYCEFVVIGNIYENPELLEVKND